MNITCDCISSLYHSGCEGLGQRQGVPLLDVPMSIMNNPLKVYCLHHKVPLKAHSYMNLVFLDGPGAGPALNFGMSVTLNHTRFNGEGIRNINVQHHTTPLVPQLVIKSSNTTTL